MAPNFLLNAYQKHTLMNCIISQDVFFTLFIHNFIYSKAFYKNKNYGSVAKFENQTRPLWTPNILGWYSH